MKMNKRAVQVMLILIGAITLIFNEFVVGLVFWLIMASVLIGLLLVWSLAKE